MVPPDFVTVNILFGSNVFVFQLAVKSFHWEKGFAVEFMQRRREKTFWLRAFVCFHIFIIIETGGQIVDDVQKYQSFQGNSCYAL